MKIIRLVKIIHQLSALLNVILSLLRHVLSLVVNMKTFTIYLLFSSNCWAWSGYDYENKTQINIEPGNLVREGLVIQFYDVKSDAYHMAKVLVLEENSGGTTVIKAEDLETKKERSFLMDRE